MVKKSLRSVKTVWDYLTGTPSEFALEARIFNSLCIIGLLAIAYRIPVNLSLSLSYSIEISITLFCIQSYLYYLARFKKQLETSILLTGINIHTLLVLNYFINAGIEGPTLILLALTFFLIITVASKKSNFIWIFVNLILVLGLLITEYYYPKLITNPYNNRSSLFIDTASLYLVVIILIYTGSTYMRDNYKKEKASAERRAISMEKLNDEKDKLFSIISHDLRAPLATIHDYLQILSEENLDPAEKRSFENDLLQITRNTQDLLTNILTWSASQMEGLNAKIQEINVLVALRPTLTVQRAIAAKKDLKLSYAIDPSLQILADPDMLQVIIRNLINNSIKFTKPGGEIHIECRQLKTNCLFAVRDTGIGMSNNKLAEIFSLKAHSTYGTHNEKGVGLGLLLCNEFTEAQNGKIWVESTEGHGTVFYISLPSDEKALEKARQIELFSL